MAKSQRAKGIRGELEACAVLGAATGLSWERSANQSRGGGVTAPDVCCSAYGMDNLQVEVKRGRAPLLWRALKQATDDGSTHGRVPVVLARADHGHPSSEGRMAEESWVVLCYLTDVEFILESLLSAKGLPALCEIPTREDLDTSKPAQDDSVSGLADKVIEAVSLELFGQGQGSILGDLVTLESLKLAVEEVLSE